MFSITSLNNKYLQSYQAIFFFNNLQTDVESAEESDELTIQYKVSGYFMSEIIFL